MFHTIILKWHRILQKILIVKLLLEIGIQVSGVGEILSITKRGGEMKDSRKSKKLLYKSLSKEMYKSLKDRENGKR